MVTGTVIGIFGAIALGGLIAGLVWWMRALDRSRGTPESAKHNTDGISAAFKRGGPDVPR
jgi:hypothetical protein